MKTKRKNTKIKVEGLDKLVNYIEENIRATDNSGIDYIDPRNYTKRLRNRQNHVIFGRRGSGKTTLLKSLDKNNEIILVKIQVEDYKDLSFPNILIHILKKVFKELKTKLKADLKWLQINKKYRANSLILKIENQINKFEKQLDEPDEFERNESQSIRNDKNISAGINLGEANLTTGQSKNIQHEQSRKYNIRKLDKIKIGN